MEKLRMTFLILGAIGVLLGSTCASAQSEATGETEPTLQEWAQTGSYQIDANKDGKLTCFIHQLIRNCRFMRFLSPIEG